ncbi:ARABIDOPSIS ORTHOLOG OF SUGAR BEET HS1 PRO-1 2, ortholog of sugar beet HS1 PRO-1 2 [Hibiscus trionum]|uniref:ARABIDOPSIS ORTHOLOG OF SUGAR BEET HS1 PRO-1 2, ortholog of sugar beet HS1 PRO-1 2 n=1 Tax=Hibiscus trionum TaxID=183268 RepID=A0A9W7I6H8_HIBTR|nr:ARABIDOPSIS ORTHOLOG OF SUGAR BEET HS1 PRO-1 2, ortholog of sugar beet HS1 PRO-1 2 [Hibiscus trionum]
MVDLEWKAKMVSSDIPSKSPSLSNKLHVSIATPSRLSNISSPLSTSSAYDYYLRLPELRKLWETKEFPAWQNERILKPALHALEITFRFISIVLSDPRSYSNRREWTRRLESLTTSQIELIAMLCEDEDNDKTAAVTAPIVDLTSSNGVLARESSSAEVWKLHGETTVVSRTSEASLLPRLATWQRSEGVAQKILYSIECEMRSCPYTLGLGEPNLSGKPNLDYDAVCKPNDLHALKKNPYDDRIENHENATLYTTHQILESWIHTAKQVLKRIASRIDGESFEAAASDCYLMEKIWKLLAEIEDLHLLMDPDDFLHLKSQLLIKQVNETEAYCFRSKGLVEITNMSKELKHRVPFILGVEVDPKGGPRIQEAAMRLYIEKKEGNKVFLLQALQAIEGALKRFFYGYKQVLLVVMGSLEAKGSRVAVGSGSVDLLSQIFLEPTYFPSLDAAKTFLGEFWSHELGGSGLTRWKK